MSTVVIGFLCFLAGSGAGFAVGWNRATQPGVMDAKIKEYEAKIEEMAKEIAAKVKDRI